MAIAEALKIVGLKNTDAIKTGETVINGFSGVIAIYSLANKAANLLGLWNGPGDPYEKKLNDIIKELEKAVDNLKLAIKEAIKVDIDIDKRTQIANQFGGIYNAIQAAETFHNNPSEELEEILTTSIIDIQKAINSMLSPEGKEGYFQHIYIEQMMYRAWNGELLNPPTVPDAHGGNGSGRKVWDYRYVLPCILKAISMYLVATGVARPDFKIYSV